jgi:Trk-type K+ transport system membrane component
VQWLPAWEAAFAFCLLAVGAILLFFCETPWGTNIIWKLPESWIPQRPVAFDEGLVSIRDEMTYPTRWTMCVFISSTIRSAGLQSIPLSEGAISWPSYGLFLLWMLIGGSASGIAGGMRTSCLVVVAICLFTLKRSWTQTPRGPIKKRALIRVMLLFMVGWLLLNGVAVLTLALTTDGTPYELVFDGVAACNNVGLSTGLTLHLTSAGRLVIILVMVVGRVVPLAFWLGVSRMLAAPDDARKGKPEQA